MTAPQRELCAVSVFREWRCPLLSIDVLCANEVLEAIRVEAVDGLTRLTHGGLETGGILFGRKTERCVEILASQPLDCEYSTGPSFVLSGKDEIGLQAALADPKRGMLQPVGLYMTHSRRGFSLAEADLRILDRYFPELWQIALLLMPARLGPTRAGFFIRSPAGEPAYLCAHELLIQAPERRGNGGEPEVPDTLDKPEESEGVSASPVGVAVVPAPSSTECEGMDGQALALDRFNSFLAQEEKHRRMGWWTLVATLAVVMLAGAIAASLWTRSRVSPSPGALLHISDLGPQLRIEWDPAREPIRAATGATLEIRDGDSPPNNLPITRDGLDSGSIVYSPRSEKIEVRLNLLHGKEPASESVPYFIINPVRSTDSRSLAPVPIMQSAPPSVASEPVSEAQSEEPIGVHTTEHESASTQMPALSAHPRKTTRAFHPPVKRPSGSANLEAKASLPDLPEIHTAQPALSVPLPSALPIGARPPTAPMVSQTRAKDRALPASGRLIWTGDLRKNGLLSLSPSGASQGVLNGHLPGFSVKVSVQPAELVDGGIAVFSSDRTRSGASELPSARNGWNVVIYRWDPKRTSAVTIIEPPGPANGWGHLVLRNGNHNLSVLVIDWQREEGQ